MRGFVIKCKVTSQTPRTGSALRFTRGQKQKVVRNQLLCHLSSPPLPTAPLPPNHSPADESSPTFALLYQAQLLLSPSLPCSLGSAGVCCRMAAPKQQLQNPVHRATHLHTSKHSPGSLSLNFPKRNNRVQIAFLSLINQLWQETASITQYKFTAQNHLCRQVGGAVLGSIKGRQTRSSVYMAVSQGTKTW